MAKLARIRALDRAVRPRIRAENIHHLPALKDNDVFLGSVIACFDQPLPLPLALLFEFTDSVFREIHPITTVAEVG
ncbi:MAG: hypothetical protein ABSH28_00945 [Acidobacteriota bacterium]|jgi:hypothetical protein